MARILAVDDNEQSLLLISLHLREPEFEVAAVRTGVEALELAPAGAFDLVLLDVDMPEMDGFEICRRLKADPRTRALPVIFLTGERVDDRDRLRGYEAGAADYITKTVRRDELAARIGTWLRIRDGQARRDSRILELAERLADAQRELAALGERLAATEAVLAADSAGDVETRRAAERRLREREPIDAPADGRPFDSGYRISDAVGSSASLRVVAGLVDRLRRSRCTVLVQCETGTGKELVARALHFDGPFAARPYIPFHCGAISPELVESELFGYVKGAFTGATGSKRGLFKAADGGTVFLDEVAEMSLELQVKLLRVLQLGEIRPVGASQPQYVDVRIIAATNQDLEALVRAGQFREDLFYRLEVVTVSVPPLRERLDDIPELVAAFLARCNERHRGGDDAHVTGLSRATLAKLCEYPWPGNIRELENVIERAFALGAGATLQVEDLPEKVRTGHPSLEVRAADRSVAASPDAMTHDERAALATSLRRQRDVSERQAILHAIEQAHGDMNRAAGLLGVSRSTLYRRCKELGVPRGRRRPVRDLEQRGD